MRELAGVKGLVTTTGDDQLLLNLRKNVHFVILKEESKLLAKVIDVSGRQTFGPNNNTAAVLLYLLTGDDGEDVLKKDYISFIMEHLPPRILEEFLKKHPDFQEEHPGETPVQYIEETIRAFLDKLETTYKILKTTVVPVGTQGAIDIDPLFDPKDPDKPGLLSMLETWEDPDLIRGKPPICKTDTYYSPNYIPGTTHR